MRRALCWILAVLASVAGAQAQNEDNLSQQLQNPIASLISVPLQSNFDFGGGPGRNGLGYTLNIQPVVPIALNDEMTLIVRTIVPIVHFERILPDHTTSLGDITQSFFFAPRSAPGGITWGVGPVFLYPTASDTRVGTERWAAGPTGVALWQGGPWTVGILANHLWSFAGDATRADVNATFLQPFVSYQFPNRVVLSLNTESTYDWTARQWTVPINLAVSRVFVIDRQPINLQIGLKYYAVHPDAGPQWGIRAGVTFLFPQ